MANKRRSSHSLRIRIASNVRSLRKQKGWSQEDLADATGLHRTYIGSVERAERNLSLSTLEIIADAFDIEIVDLFQENTSDHG